MELPVCRVAQRYGKLCVVLNERSQEVKESCIEFCDQYVVCNSGNLGSRECFSGCPPTAALKEGCLRV